MTPAEVAAAVAREVDQGVGAALAAADTPGVLVLQSVTARVGTLTSADATWQAELRFAVDPDHARTPTRTDEPALLPAVAALPVRAVSGVGPRWAGVLTAAGHDTVGALAAASPATVTGWVAEHGAAAAALVARARSCELAWPARPASARPVTVGEVMRGGPQVLGDPGPVAAAAWAACLTLVAALDLDAVGPVTVPRG